MFEAEFWVAAAFVIFMAVLGHFQVHKKLLKGIDGRRDRIKGELDEARRLKEEAQALLAAYQRKQHEVEDEAQTILASARAEAERLAGEAAARMEEFVARRSGRSAGTRGRSLCRCRGGRCGGRIDPCPYREGRGRGNAHFQRDR